MTKRSKIAVIGAGNVGTTCAQMLALKELGDVVLVDLPEKLDATKGKVLDLIQCAPIERFDANITATSQYHATTGSDLVIITAGIPRRPGMSRDDLIQTNVKIVAEVTRQAAAASPHAVLLVVSNPLDAMVYTAWKTSNFPTNRVVGQAGCLDIARFRCFIALELGCSVEDVQAMLLGGHGDDMVPLPRYASVAGIPISQLIAPDRLASIVQRTRQGGGEIVKLMGTSAYYAPAAGAVQMAEAILKDKKRILPCAAYCDHQYDIGGYFVGVPCLLGAAGVEKILQIELDTDERKMLRASVAHVKELSALVDKLL